MLNLFFKISTYVFHVTFFGSNLGTVRELSATINSILFHELSQDAGVLDVGLDPSQDYCLLLLGPVVVQGRLVGGIFLVKMLLLLKNQYTEVCVRVGHRASSLAHLVTPPLGKLTNICIFSSLLTLPCFPLAKEMFQLCEYWGSFKGV